HFQMYLGLKHIEPFVEDAVEQMKRDGIEEAVSIVLAPHYSTFSVKSYNGRAIAAAEKLGGLTICPIESWYENKTFIQYWTEEVASTFFKMSEEEKEKAIVIFSAHSLPEKILLTGDPYPNQLQATADAIAKNSGIKHYTIGWQSAGNTGEPWIGPDVQDLTRDLYKQGYRTFVYCPVGFVSDHLEVLYDNDVECKVITEELQATYYRPAMPNSNPLFIRALGEEVLAKYELTHKENMQTT
ncbi:MAG: ferrochelatase, partial [Bacillaceae bacterium]